MKKLIAERDKQSNFWLGANEERQCDLNNRSNAYKEKPTQTTSVSEQQPKQALPAQQLRFWN
jgi:hypothetical protein